MSNHFHLCIATPRGNLSEGMRWLQATFATKFNRFRKESGRLFQGRFKSLVVEPGTHLLELVDYIHLNPVRARLTLAKELRKYRWTSLNRFPKTASRPQCLKSWWMDYAESLADTRVGWNRYCAVLEAKASGEAKEFERLERRMNRGWCIGSPHFKKSLSMDLLEKAGAIRLEADELKEFNRTQWEALLDRCLSILDMNARSATQAKNSEPWKLAIATKMKRETSVTNAWLSERLSMGAPNAVSDYCGKYSKTAERKCPFARKLEKLKTER